MTHNKTLKLLSSIADATNNDFSIGSECEVLHTLTNDFFNTETQFHDSLFKVISEKKNLKINTVIKVRANIGSDETEYRIKMVGVSEKLRGLNGIEIDSMFFVKSKVGYNVYCIFMNRVSSKRFVKSFQVDSIELVK